MRSRWDILRNSWLAGVVGLILVSAGAASAQPGTLKVKKVIVAEYWAWYLTSDSQVYGFCNFSPTVVKWNVGGRKIIDGSGGYNEFRVLDDEGYIRCSRIDGTVN